MLKTKGLINTRKRQRLHIKPCSLQAVNNYQTAFESRVKKKNVRLAGNSRTLRNFAKKKQRDEGKRERIKG